MDAVGSLSTYCQVPHLTTHALLFMAQTSQLSIESFLSLFYESPFILAQPRSQDIYAPNLLQVGCGQRAAGMEVGLGVVKLTMFVHQGIILP